MDSVSELQPIPPPTVRWDETIPPGGYWTGVVPRWSTLRIIDLDGRGSGSCLFFNATQTTERYNAPDTVRSRTRSS